MPNKKKYKRKKGPRDWDDSDDECEEEGHFCKVDLFSTKNPTRDKSKVKKNRKKIIEDGEMDTIIFSACNSAIPEEDRKKMGKKKFTEKMDACYLDLTNKMDDNYIENLSQITHQYEKMVTQEDMEELGKLKKEFKIDLLSREAVKYFPLEIMPLELSLSLH